MIANWQTGGWDDQDCSIERSFACDKGKFNFIVVFKVRLTIACCFVIRIVITLEKFETKYVSSFCC